MLGREVEGDAVVAIAQERLGCHHRLEDAGFSFLTQIFVDAAKVRHQADHPLGHVGVEIVADDLPRCRRWRQANRLSRNDTKSASVRVSPMEPRTLPEATSNAAIRAFVPCRIYSNPPPFDVSRLHRQARRSMFQRLNTGHFVDRDGLHARLGNGGCRLIQPADIGALGVEVGIRLGRQPVAVAMRLEIRFFLRAARQSRARCF
jgi:hypothetical protein